MKKSMVSMMVVAAMCVALFAGQGMATVLNLTMTQGASLTHPDNFAADKWIGQTEYGFFYVGAYYDGTSPTKTYWQYDLSSLGTGATINSVKIQTNQTSALVGAAFTQYLYAAGSDAWTTTGLAWGTAPTQGDLLVTSTTADDWAGQTDIFGNTEALTTFVQGQYAGDKKVSFMVEATGLVIVDGAGGPRKMYYRTGASAPVLTIDYTVPEPATLTMLGLGIAGLLGRRKKA